MIYGSVVDFLMTGGRITLVASDGRRNQGTEGAEDRIVSTCQVGLVVASTAASQVAEESWHGTYVCPELDSSPLLILSLCGVRFKKPLTEPLRFRDYFFSEQELRDMLRAWSERAIAALDRIVQGADLKGDAIMVYLGEGLLQELALALIIAADLRMQSSSDTGTIMDEPVATNGWLHLSMKRNRRGEEIGVCYFKPSPPMTLSKFEKLTQLPRHWIDLRRTGQWDEIYCRRKEAYLHELFRPAFLLLSLLLRQAYLSRLALTLLVVCAPASTRSSEVRTSHLTASPTAPSLFTA